MQGHVCVCVWGGGACPRTAASPADISSYSRNRRRQVYDGSSDLRARGWGSEGRGLPAKEEAAGSSWGASTQGGAGPAGPEAPPPGDGHRFPAGSSGRLAVPQRHLRYALKPWVFFLSWSVFGQKHGRNRSHENRSVKGGVSTAEAVGADGAASAVVRGCGGRGTGSSGRWRGALSDTHGHHPEAGSGLEGRVWSASGRLGPRAGLRGDGRLGPRESTPAGGADGVPPHGALGRAAVSSTTAAGCQPLKVP